MPSTIIKCPADEWVRVSVASKRGVIQLRKGRVYLTQQEQDPNTMRSSIGRNGDLSLKNTRVYYDTRREPLEFIWAFSESGESEIDVTPVGGIL